MKILYVGSEYLQMTGPLFALNRMGHEVGMYPTSVEKMEDDEEQEQQLETFIKKEKVDFALSLVFNKEVARATNRLGIKYAAWSADSPAFTAWIPEANYDNCYLFYFDYREYELKKQGGQSNAYHLPLAADTSWAGHVVITDEEIKKYSCDMSFVGGLYSGNVYDRNIGVIPMRVRNALTEIIEKSAFMWDGQDRLHIPLEAMHTIERECPQILDIPRDMPIEYFLKTYLLGRKLTNVERTLLMELLSQRYDICLYTRETEQVPEGVKRLPEILVSESFKIFYTSKINLNITLRSIASGIPLRVFDVMGVGAFMLSNWQEEIPELFVEGKEIVTYKTPEELIDKADYYLRHEDERVRIAVNGYRKVKEQHTYEHRLSKIISILFPSL